MNPITTYDFTIFSNERDRYRNVVFDNSGTEVLLSNVDMGTVYHRITGRGQIVFWLIKVINPNGTMQIFQTTIKSKIATHYEEMFMNGMEMDDIIAMVQI